VAGSAEGRKPYSPARAVYGRRKGPRLSPRKRALLDRVLPQLAIRRPEPHAGALDLGALFGRPHERYALEIGFGKGEHLAARAAAEPETGFIGCEPYLNGLVAFLDRAEQQGLGNVRLYGDDARHILEALAEGALDAVYLIHPDPWPKRRHAKRRFVNSGNLDAIARVLRPGGELLVVTDHPVYRHWTAVQMARRTEFDWTAERAADWRTPPPDWIETRYAEKAQRAGRPVTFFHYLRTEPPPP